MKLSIIIVNWNTRDLLARCLSSIQLNPPDELYDVWVVDNASQDDSVSMVQEQFPTVHLIANTANAGFARANNQAIRACSGDYVLVLNSDTEIQPSALQHLVRILEATPQAGAAGPKMLNPDRTLQNSYGSLPSVLDELVGPYLFDLFTKPWGRIGSKWLVKQLNSDPYLRVDRVSFACTLIRRKVLEKVGLLDEQFLFYSEDYDWFRRIKKAGWWAIFCPQAEVIHYWGGSSKKNNEWALSQLYRSKRIYFAKQGGPLSESILRLGLTVRFAAKLAVASLPGRNSTMVHTYRRLIREMMTAR